MAEHSAAACIHNVHHSWTVDHTTRDTSRDTTKHHQTCSRATAVKRVSGQHQKAG